MSPRMIGALLTLPYALVGQILWALVCVPIGLFFIVFVRSSWRAPMDWSLFWLYILTPMDLWREEWLR